MQRDSASVGDSDIPREFLGLGDADRIKAHLSKVDELVCSRESTGLYFLAKETFDLDGLATELDTVVRLLEAVAPSDAKTLSLLFLLRGVSQRVQMCAYLTSYQRDAHIVAAVVEQKPEGVVAEAPCFAKSEPASPKSSTRRKVVRRAA